MGRGAPRSLPPTPLSSVCCCAVRGIDHGVLVRRRDEFGIGIEIECSSGFDTDTERDIHHLGGSKTPRAVTTSQPYMITPLITSAWRGVRTLSAAIRRLSRHGRGDMSRSSPTN